MGRMIEYGFEAHLVQHVGKQIFFRLSYALLWMSMTSAPALSRSR